MAEANLDSDEVPHAGAAPHDEIEALDERIRGYYALIPRALVAEPETQLEALHLVQEAERVLIPPVDRTHLIDAHLHLAQVDIEIERSRGARGSSYVLAGILYLVGLFILAGQGLGLFRTGVDALTMNGFMLIGIPVPIWLWAVIGSLTSMLLRAGNFPFRSWHQALRWFLFRPIAGIVMGVMTYLMVKAGLLILSGESEPQAPELLWVIAFAGAFSDTLSITLMDRLTGRLALKDKSAPPSAPSQGAV